MFPRSAAPSRSPTTTTSTTDTSAAGDPNDHLTFSQVGTSMSAAIVTGAYSMTASALNYWISLYQAGGVTSDAYLTTPVGVDSLDFGAGGIKNLTAYNTPDGINGILAYTAVPATDTNDAGSLSTPQVVSGTTRLAVVRPGLDQQCHCLDRGHGRHQLPAQEQRFPVDRHQRRWNHHGPGVAKLHGHRRVEGAGRGWCHGRLCLAGLRPPRSRAGDEQRRLQREPRSAGALQRRFNYFDYIANGQLKGGISHQLVPHAGEYVAPAA